MRRSVFLITALLLLSTTALTQTSAPGGDFRGPIERAPSGEAPLPPLPEPFQGLDIRKLLGIPAPPRSRGALPESGDKLSDKPSPPATKRKATPSREADEKSETEAAAELKKALAPKPPPEALRRQRLDDLFARLQKAGNSTDAARIAEAIQQIYLQFFSDTGNLLMQRAVEALQKEHFEVALSLLDKLILLAPDWAEAWNQRATVRYLTGDYDGSMADIHQVLKLEPRHFGALTGMGMILRETGFDRDALKIFNQALSIYPLEPDIRKLADQLTLEVEGRGI